MTCYPTNFIQKTLVYIDAEIEDQKRESNMIVISLDTLQKINSIFNRSAIRSIFTDFMDVLYEKFDRQNVTYQLSCGERLIKLQELIICIH